MPETDTERDRAAYVLSNEIGRMEIDLERAEIVVQELTDSYFAMNQDNERGRFGIMWEYDRARVHADIVADYLYEIRKSIEELTKMYRRHMDEKAAKKAESEGGAT